MNSRRSPGGIARTRDVRELEVRSAKDAVVQCLWPPPVVSHLTDETIIFYSPLSVLVPDASFFWSRSMQIFIGDNALVFGAAIDGIPVSVPHGMETAIKEDVAFIGSRKVAVQALRELIGGE